MTTKKNEQVSFDIYPVAWHGDKATKLQAKASFGGKSIYGDPMPTEAEALEALSEEIELWLSASIEIASRFDDEYPKQKRPCRN